MSLEQKFKTGVLWQDIQHQQLIDLLESFSEADEVGQDKFTYTLAFLVMYVNHHFGLEEAYMEAYAYSGLAAHKLEHAAYIQQLKEFRQAHSRYSKEAGDALQKTILAWILKHIMGDDQKLGKFILIATSFALMRTSPCITRSSRGILTWGTSSAWRVKFSAPEWEKSPSK